MQNRAALFFLTAALILTAVLLGGCSATDDTTEMTPDLSVNIVVPYATTTPVPEATSGPSAPFTVDSGGKVTIWDNNWVDSDFASVDHAVTQTDYTQLRLGDQGQDVQNLQTRLLELKYYSGGISGVFDDATQRAVELFELTYGTMQTGIATAKLQILLFVDTAPEYGSQEYNRAKAAYYEKLERNDAGSQVLALQYRLQELGYPMTNLTGRFDDETAAAVALFYAEYDFDPSDVVDVSMQNELYSENARTYSKKAENGDDSTSNLTTLSEGNIGTLVEQVQARLIELQYMEGSPTGTFDSATTEAVKGFQASMGVEQTGVLNEWLQGKLFASDAPVYGSDSSNNVQQGEYQLLQMGDSGDAVHTLQTRLIELGYANGISNGKYEAATVSAVKLFQRNVQLEETGVATSALQTLLFAADAPIYEPSSTTAPTDQSRDRYYPYDLELVELASGSEEELVVYLQTRLKELGFFEGEVDGEFGDKTKDAIRGLQKAMGISRTGEASISFQEHLYSDAAPIKGVSFYSETKKFKTMQLGDSSSTVEKLQKQLWELGYLERSEVEDSIGTYNDVTEGYVTEAQREMGYVNADGVATPEFQAFIFSKYCTKIKKN